MVGKRLLPECDASVMNCRSARPFEAKAYASARPSRIGTSAMTAERGGCFICIETLRPRRVYCVLVAGECGGEAEHTVIVARVRAEQSCRLPVYLLADTLQHVDKREGHHGCVRHTAESSTEYFDEGCLNGVFLL